MAKRIRTLFTARSGRMPPSVRSSRPRRRRSVSPWSVIAFSVIDADLSVLFGAASTGAALSLLTSIVSAPIGGASPSLVNTTRRPEPHDHHHRRPRRSRDLAPDRHRRQVARQRRAQAGDDPDEVLVVDGNLLLNAGITRLLNLLVGAGGQAFGATHCRVAVGDSSTAASASQTDLQAATNKYYKLVDSVTVSGQTRSRSSPPTAARGATSPGTSGASTSAPRTARRSRRQC